VSRNIKRILLAGIVLVAAGAGGAVAVQAGSGDDQSATGPQSERAGAAAVKIAGGGSATSVERDAEGDRVWEVEVAKPDGTTLEVDLDAALRRVAAEPEDTETGERDDAGDDEANNEADDADGAGEGPDDD